VPAERLIFAGVSGSPGSVHALRYAADLDRQHDAILVPLLSWVPPGGDLDERKHPCLQLRQLWKDDAWQRLWAALDTAAVALGISQGCLHNWVRQDQGRPGTRAGLPTQEREDLTLAGRRTREQHSSGRGRMSRALTRVMSWLPG
jgi:hypothetical protein